MSPRLIKWAFNVSNWDPDPVLLSMLTSKLPPTERSRIKEFRFPIDGCRALLGQILIRVAILVLLDDQHLQWDDIDVQRTEFGKPYLARPEGTNVQFNLSHHGDWIIIAAGFGAPLGVDVAKVELAPSDTITSFFDMFDEYFTRTEWAYIRGRGVASEDTTNWVEDARLHRFYHLWSLKESYVKALGLGLGLELRRIEFTIAGPDESGGAGDTFEQITENLAKTMVTVSQDGIPQSGFYFAISYLDSVHPAALCRQEPSSLPANKPLFETVQWDFISPFVLLT
ncbi:4'-phosphopantetheinyl transferase superfamily [Phlyctochytrium arcticum]|nr:4'-phosphopantetheinyl transferase superfamily [Phlyctochytrium arcticum]